MRQTAEKEDLVQNLRAAACGEAAIQAITEAVARGDRPGAMRLLERHRQGLLERYHECGRSIDCLDYLVFQMDREETK